VFITENLRERERNTANTLENLKHMLIEKKKNKYIFIFLAMHIFSRIVCISRVISRLYIRLGSRERDKTIFNTF